MAKNHDIDKPDVKQRYPARLQTLCHTWSKKWAGPLQHTQKLIKLWTSGYYDKNYARWHLINLMSRGASTIVSYLCEGNPKILVQPLAPKLRQYAYSRQLVMNFLADKNNFAENVLIPGATLSMFGGVAARTFFEYDRIISLKDDVIKVGTPKVAIIEPADYIGDPSAKRRDDFVIEGDVYRLPTRYAKDLFAKKDGFGRQIADFISPDCKLATEYSVEETTHGFDYNKFALEEYTTFIDVYNRRDKVIETIMPMGKKAVILKGIAWKGPGTPYDYLGYVYPPNCPIPLPPAWEWYDLDVSENRVALTARQQAEAQKNIIAADPGAKEAAEAALKNPNMNVVIAKGMEAVKTHSLGGMAPENYNWIRFCEAQFTKTGIPAESLRGVGAEAPTATQEQLIFKNATRIVNGFYNKFHSWMTDILRKWSWAVGAAPNTYIEILDELNLPGIGRWEYPVVFSKADNVADFEQFVLKVVPYSTQRTHPELQYQRLMQLMTSWMIPTMPMREAQGATIDLPMVDRLLADYGGFENFPQWYRSVIPHELSGIDYVMKTKDSKNKFGQGNDSYGSTITSGLANAAQQQTRTTGGPEGLGGFTKSEL